MGWTLWRLPAQPQVAAQYLPKAQVDAWSPHARSRDAEHETKRPASIQRAPKKIQSPLTRFLARSCYELATPRRVGHSVARRLDFARNLLVRMQPREPGA